MDAVHPSLHKCMAAHLKLVTNKHRRSLHAHFDTGSQLLLDHSTKVQSNSVIMSKLALLHVVLDMSLTSVAVV